MRMASLELELDYGANIDRECVCDADTLDMYGCECDAGNSDPDHASDYVVDDVMNAIYDAVNSLDNQPSLDFCEDPTCSGEFQFRNAPDDINAWAPITRAFDRRGWYPSRRCGAHVHVDVSGIPTAKVMSIVPIYLALETELFAIAASGMNHRGNHFCHYVGNFLASRARPNPKPHNMAVELRRERYLGLNLSNALANCACGAVVTGMSELCECREKRTVEFRLWDSSLNPERLAVYVALSRGIVDRSFDAFDRYGEPSIPGFHDKYLLRCVPAELRESLQSMMRGGLKDRVS